MLYCCSWSSDQVVLACSMFGKGWTGIENTGAYVYHIAHPWINFCSSVRDCKIN